MKKAFTLIELLLVMTILGTIIGIIVFNQRILNYKTIYAAYQKKATADVLDATNMALLKNPGLRSYSEVANSWGKMTRIKDCTSDIYCLYYFYKTAIKGKPCEVKYSGTNVDPKNDVCKIGTNFSIAEEYYINSDGSRGESGSIGALPRLGFRMKNGEVIMLGTPTLSCDATNSEPCFYVYVDMNGKKGPNIYGQDRYRFKLFKDTIAHDDRLDVPYVNTSALSEAEEQEYREYENKYLVAISQGDQEDFVKCWKSAPFAKTKLNCKDQYRSSDL